MVSGGAIFYAGGGSKAWLPSGFVTCPVQAVPSQYLSWNRPDGSLFQPAGAGAGVGAGVGAGGGAGAGWGADAGWASLGGVGGIPGIGGGPPIPGGGPGGIPGGPGAFAGAPKPGGATGGLPDPAEKPAGASGELFFDLPNLGILIPPLEPCPNEPSEFAALRCRYAK